MQSGSLRALIAAVAVLIAGFALGPTAAVQAASPPANLVDHYFMGGSTLDQYYTDAEDWGCSEPNASGVVVLDFMAPAQETISGSVVYGTQQNYFPNGIMSDQDIANVWAYFYTGLTASSINGQQCVNHSGDVIMTAVSASNSTGNYEPTNYTSWGQKWVQMIESIYNPAPSAVPLEGGMDIEEGTAYLGPSPTEAMATGFNEDDTSPYYILWDFGSDNGGTSPGNGWTANDVYALATGLPAGGLYFEWDGPLPEIYSINYDGMADDWMSLSCYEIGQGNSAAAFPGLTSDGSPTTSWYYLYADTSNANDGYGETNDKTCSAETNGGSTLNYLSTF